MNKTIITLTEHERKVLMTALSSYNSDLRNQGQYISDKTLLTDMLEDSEAIRDKLL